jgi:hypothetical protein
MVISINFNNLEYLSNLSGSTGAKLFHNTNSNKKFVVKKSIKGGGYEQVYYESLANDIYELLGIHTPKHILDSKNKALILEYIEGKELGIIYNKDKTLFEKVKKELMKGFIIDALLANWDVIGLEMDNIVVSNKNIPYRIDNGGSFHIRAQGGKKQFDDVVNEIYTMRGIEHSGFIGSKNSIRIFKDLTDKDIYHQILTIIIPNQTKILALVSNELKPIMKKRIQFLINLIPNKFNSTLKNKIKSNKIKGLFNKTIRKLR